MSKLFKITLFALIANYTYALSCYQCVSMVSGRHTDHTFDDGCQASPRIGPPNECKVRIGARPGEYDANYCVTACGQGKVVQW